MVEILYPTYLAWRERKIALGPTVQYTTVNITFLFWSDISTSASEPMLRFISVAANVVELTVSQTYFSASLSQDKEPDKAGLLITCNAAEIQQTK